MATQRTPGVYVEEITKFPPSVAPVATAIPAFIGYTEKAEDIAIDDLLGTPKRITSMLEYETYFGSAQNEANIVVDVTINDKIIVTNNSPSAYLMYYSMQMYFANGGGPCYVTSVGSYSDSIVLTNLEDGLAAIRKEDEPTLLLFPDATGLSSSDFYAINNSSLTQCNELQDRFTIMNTYDDENTAITNLRNGINLGKDYLKYGAAYYPFLDTILNYIYKDSGVNVNDSTTAASESAALALTASITTSISSWNGLATSLIAERDNVFSAANDSAAQIALPDAITAVKNIVDLFNSLKEDFDKLLQIGKDEAAVEGDEVQNLEGWITTNIDDVLVGLNQRLEKLENSLTASQSVMTNALSELATNSVYYFLGFVNPPVPALAIPVAALTVNAALTTVVANEMAALNSALATPQVIQYTLNEIETINNALYNRIKAAINDFSLTLPPSSAMAGIYARVDGTNGVWKAPANVGVSYVVKPTVQISQEEQGDMNVTSTGKSVNAIRTFTGKGTMVWGARTLAGNDNEWRYISVRRFFNFVEESVSEASEQFVFESNDANTWVRVRGMIENFLNLQWKAGALAGAKADDAYYVNIGLGSTMTSQDILEGRMIIEIGMAAVRPAEFIVLRFSHKMQES